MFKDAAMKWVDDSAPSAGAAIAFYTIFSLAPVVIFKVLPDAHIHWRAAWLGGLWTSVLFTLGKTVIGFYLAQSDVLSSYGAAGTFVLVLLWVYYSSLIFLYGAELTWLWHRRQDKKSVRPRREAVTASPSESSGAA